MYLCNKSPLKSIITRLSIRIFIRKDNAANILKLLDIHLVKIL
jgi:hypothetical protein